MCLLSDMLHLVASDCLATLYQDVGVLANDYFTLYMYSYPSFFPTSLVVNVFLLISHAVLVGSKSNLSRS